MIGMAMILLKRSFPVHAAVGFVTTCSRDCQVLGVRGRRARLLPAAAATAPAPAARSVEWVHSVRAWPLYMLVVATQVMQTM